MIVVFVIDTSPSMGKPLVPVDGSPGTENRTAGNGMSRLDLAKMTIEDVVRGLNKRVAEHNLQLQQNPQLLKNLRNLGLGFSPNDEFLLLSTGRQHPQQPATAACGAGGRLLVGYGDHTDQSMENTADHPVQHHSINCFQKELKRLQASDWGPGRIKPGSNPKKLIPFPEDGGGAIGLNAALSAGLQLLSRYRLSFRSTENYGMGRLPSPAVLNPGGGGAAIHALQPACLILITDGVCLRSTPSEGGGSLQLQYGNMPLKEFYQEPFRWDQRIFCLGVGGREGISSSQYLHPHLRALCEVTGGSHMMLRSSASLSQTTDKLLNLIAPPRPRDLPIPEPTRIQPHHSPLVGAIGTFVSGGPVCCFQALEPDIDTAQPSPKFRAMLLYVPHEVQQPAGTGQNTGATNDPFQPPTWCIPESFFPSKKLDTLPPRPAQPNLLFVRYPTRLGSKSFDAVSLIKALNRLDQLVLANRKAQGIHQVKLLKRDVYICEWISSDKSGWGPQNPPNMEYFPVLVVGAGRPALNEGEANYFNIGILHIPSGTSALGSSLTSGTNVSTLTLLPPEPHILLPLLIRAAELEHRQLKKMQVAESKDPGHVGKGGSMASLLQKQAASSRNVHLDDQWRNEFRAYLFRVPPYYQQALKRSLRGVLPASAQPLLNAEGPEGALPSQCFSKTCLQRIRTAEQITREKNERLERQEAELRRRGNFESPPPPQQQQQQAGKRWSNDQSVDHKASVPIIGYGQYDPRSTPESFLAALKNLPRPHAGIGAKLKDNNSVARDVLNETNPIVARSAMEVLGDLPANCLMAYYESRRRWIFGGSGISTKGLFVDGVCNDGTNTQHCGPKRDILDESLLSLAGVGVSQLNATTTTKMGDYRERLLWSRAPVVGYGSNFTGVAATTAPNGAPVWSVDDDAMPMSFFDARTGEFVDNIQARVRSRLMVNFGNPYKDKRANSLVPEKYLNQSPSMRKGLDELEENVCMTPPGSPPHGSPPHDSFSEGEGEAVFAGRTGSILKSPRRSDDKADQGPIKRQRLDSDRRPMEVKSAERGKEEVPKHPPPPPKKGGGSVGPPPPPPTKMTQKKNPLPPNRPPPPRSKAQPPAPKAPPFGRQPSLQKPPPPHTSSSTPSAVKPPPPARQETPSKPSTIPWQSRPGSSKKPNLPQVSGPIDMQSPDKKPSVDLPPGWMCVWSKSQKRWYFFDTKTNRSVWEWPPPKA